MFSTSVFPMILNRKLFFQTLLSLSIIVTLSSSICAQKRDLQTQFDQGILDLGQNKVKEASVIFEYLYKADSTNMNFAFLLGQSYVRLNTNLDYAIYLLEKAKEKYSPNYRKLDYSERRVSEYVFYYLLMGYSLNGVCEKTIETLNQFYSIYSFENEYYLVEGQRLHRECQSRFEIKDTAEVVVYERDVKEHWVSTKTVNYSNKQPLYGVQVGATLQPKYTWEFKGVKNVEVYVDENGIYRYIIGQFISEISAQKLLQVVRESGYADAFVVNVKDKTRFAEKVVNMDDKPIADELFGEVYFTVQVGAFKSETIPDDLTYLFVEMDNIVSINDGNWTYLTVGYFTELSEARFYNELVKDLGVKDAFVAAFNYQRKVDIRQAETYLEERKNASKKD
jgi:hypothetical protein